MDSLGTGCLPPHTCDPFLAAAENSSATDPTRPLWQGLGAQSP